VRLLAVLTSHGEESARRDDVLRFQVSATWLVIGGALAGLALGAGAVP